MREPRGEYTGFPPSHRTTLVARGTCLFEGSAIRKRATKPSLLVLSFHYIGVFRSYPQPNRISIGL